jgi:hypothetical protein
MEPPFASARPSEVRTGRARSTGSEGADRVARAPTSERCHGALLKHLPGDCRGIDDGGATPKAENTALSVSLVARPIAVGRASDANLDKHCRQ